MYSLIPVSYSAIGKGIMANYCYYLLNEHTGDIKRLKGKDIDISLDITNLSYTVGVGYELGGALLRKPVIADIPNELIICKDTKRNGYVWYNGYGHCVPHNGMLLIYSLDPINVNSTGDPVRCSYNDFKLGLVRSFI